VEKDLEVVVRESQDSEGNIIEIPEEKVDINIASDLSFEDKSKRKTDKTAMAKLIEMDSERMKFRQDTLALEREKFMWAKELDIRKNGIRGKALGQRFEKTENGIRTQRANVKDGA